MARLSLFLAALNIFLSGSRAVPPAQVPPSGKTTGFINNLNNEYPAPTGDWLTSTLCYCHSPVRAEEEWEYRKAHIFQHEYYNFHSNATFITDHLCVAKEKFEGDLCTQPNVKGDNNDWIMDGKFTCKKFKRTDQEKSDQVHSKRSTRRGKRWWPKQPSPHTCIGRLRPCDDGPFAPDPEDTSTYPEHDKVCFATGTGYYGMNKMEIKFNRQRRKMAKEGDQGRIQTDVDEVQGYCEDMCQSRFNMPADMRLKDKRAGGGSRQFVYTDVDDMCDHCK